MDPIITALVTRLAQLPLTRHARGISVVQSLLRMPVPRRAKLTMPTLAPLSDLRDLSPQVAATAIQYGPGIVGQLMPADGALMTLPALACVRFERWLRLCEPVCAVLLVCALAAVPRAPFRNRQ